MLSKDLIKPLGSPYGAPILFAKKKDRHIRLCVNYQKLSKIMGMDSYPLLCVNQLFGRLQGAKYFYRIDLHDIYFHIPIVAWKVYKTAFSYRYRTYEC